MRTAALLIQIATEIMRTRARLSPTAAQSAVIITSEIEFCAKNYLTEKEFTRISVFNRQGFLNRVKLGLIDYEGRLFLSEYSEL